MADLYAALGQNHSSDLYLIDPLTGIPSAIGPTGNGITGLAFDPTDGTLYAVTSTNSPDLVRHLVTVDPATGTVTDIGALGVTITDITFAADGTLYGWKQTTSEAVTIDKATGTVTPLGTSGIDFTFGGAIEMVAGVLYAMPKGGRELGAGGLFNDDATYYTIDVSTGAATLAGSFSGGTFNGKALPAAAADSDGIVWVIPGNFVGTGLQHFDPADGILTEIDDATNDTLQWLDALAWTVTVTPVEPDVNRLQLSDPPQWRLLVTNLAGEVLTILDKRSSERGFVFALNQPATHTGLVPSDDPEINIPSPDADSPAFLSHNTRLVYGLRREVRPSPGDAPWRCRYGGLIEGVEDVAADTPTSRYTAYDPWQYLFARPVRDNYGEFPGANGLIYRDARASDMALDLLVNTVLVDGPVFIDYTDLSLIQDTEIITGKTVFERGLSVGEAWQQLCDTGTIDIVLRPVYDPVNRPGIVCELVIRKQVGSIRFNTVMGWDRASRSITEMSRLVDGTRLANRVRLFDDQGGDPVATQSDAASIAIFGEYWAQQFMVGKSTQAALVELLALAQLQIRKNGPRSITFSPAPDRAYLSLRDYGLGDYVPVWASRALREPLGIDYDAFDPAAPGASGYQRVYAIPLELDDDGVERPGPILTSNDSANTF